jgi:hypothetical protein
MIDLLASKKGAILFIVLMAIFTVVLLSSIILTIMSTQSRLTLHQISRIQGYYAALAGINFAIDKLRLGNDPGNWPTSGNYTRTMCRSNCNITDANLPTVIQQVNITINSTDLINSTIKATVTYTYTP